MGIFLGVLAARYVNTWVDGAVSVFALLSYATPIFWIGLMLIVLFGIHLGWLPTHGMALAGTGVRGLAYALDVGRHLILPAATLSLFYVALYTRHGWAPILLSAGVFGLAHSGQGAAPAAIVLLGVVLGYLYQRTHRHAHARYTWADHERQRDHASSASPRT